MNFAEEYENLLIRQYRQHSRARAEIELYAGLFERLRDFKAEIGRAFDVDEAVGQQLDVIGRLVDRPRIVPEILLQTRFGFSINPVSRGFADRFDPARPSAPFADKFAPARDPLELEDPDYRLFLKLKIAVNNCSGVMASAPGQGPSIQEVVQVAFDGSARVVDRKNMTLRLYVDPSVEDQTILLMRRMDLIPAPAGVGYDIIIQDPFGRPFGFDNNPNTLGFADKADPEAKGGQFARKIL